MQKYQINAKAEYSLLFSDLKSLLNKFRIILLKGEMGSGKTTFTKLFLSYLDVKENVSSPTYSIVNEYQNTLGQIFYHFDLYRLKNKNELLDMGFKEYLYSGNICLIEWPDIAEPLIEEQYIEISISSVNEEQREITLRTVTK